MYARMVGVPVSLLVSFISFATVVMPGNVNFFSPFQDMHSSISTEVSLC